MRGSKTTALEPVQYINRILNKHGITDTSYGIIISIKERRDHRTNIKYKAHSGCHLLTVTNKRYKQEFRIYDSISKDILMKLLKEKLGEQYRILEKFS